MSPYLNNIVIQLLVHIKQLCYYSLPQDSLSPSLFFALTDIFIEKFDDENILYDLQAINPVVSELRYLLIEVK